MKPLTTYLNESRVDESILGGILFSIIAVAAAGLGSAIVADIQSNIVKRLDKKQLFNKIKNEFSSEDIKEINDEIENQPEIKSWNDWNSFINMIENGERIKNISSKAKDVMNDTRYELLPIEIQDGVKNFAMAA